MAASEINNDCNTSGLASNNSGPGAGVFAKPWKTPFGLPDFPAISTESYEPAFAEGIASQKAEVDAIIKSSEAPTFANTIVSLEDSGSLLRRVAHVFYALNGADTNPEMQEIARNMAPALSAHSDSINLNANLFKRIDAVFEKKNELGLLPVQMRLLKETHKGFVRSGALLAEPEKKRLQTINEELSLLTLKFGQNVLDETNRFSMVVTQSKDLDGLPQGLIDAAAEAAKTLADTPDEAWAFTLHNPRLIPFLQFSTRRSLRQKMFEANANVGNNGDELDNNNILVKIVTLRLEKSQLLGFENHAHFMLDDNMASTAERVYELLNKVWQPAIVRASEEATNMQKMIDDEAQDKNEPGFKLAPWDWWFYAEKIKKQDFDLDEEMLRPYFALDNVRQGIFTVAERLFGLKFNLLKDAPRYHSEVEVYQVTDKQDNNMAVLCLDYFPRESKRGGAWMSAFRKQSYQDDQRIIPLVFNVGNFTRPVGDKPALLSLDEVITAWHEFGHALHAILSDVPYRSLSGTSVAQDFVELPSQIFENWALEPEVLKLFARHYETGECLPESLVARMEKAKFFNQGFASTEYLAASYLDMDWHTLTNVENIDAEKFENESLKKRGLMEEIISRYRSPYFRHIFSGGYSAGYYSYLWAEVLDADAFEAFKETGNIFDPTVAKAFRENILERGGSADAMELYRAFRGQEPQPEALLKRRGLLD